MSKSSEGGNREAPKQSSPARPTETSQSMNKSEASRMGLSPDTQEQRSTAHNVAEQVARQQQQNQRQESQNAARETQRAAESQRTQDAATKAEAARKSATESSAKQAKEAKRAEQAKVPEERKSREDAQLRAEAERKRSAEAATKQDQETKRAEQSKAVEERKTREDAQLRAEGERKQAEAATKQDSETKRAEQAKVLEDRKTREDAQLRAEGERKRAAEAERKAQQDRLAEQAKSEQASIRAKEGKGPFDSHALERHGPQVTDGELKAQLERNPFQEHATRFNSDKSLQEARERLVAEHGDRMKAQSEKAARLRDTGTSEALTQAKELEVRYAGSTELDKPIGNGVDREGKRVDDIRAATGVWRYDRGAEQWSEKTIYPDAGKEKPK